MRTHGICVNPDELCASISHPLSYYRRKARFIMRRERTKPVREQPRRNRD
jgi:DNA primase large subunit